MPITHLDLPHLLASTDAADFSGRRKLEDVAVTIAKAKKVVVVSGAGISCSSGIPDFRSADGLYSLVKKRYPDAFVTGKDLFSSGLFTNPSTTSIFLTFIAELSLACTNAKPTRTHHFIHKLDKCGKLLRSYTQNVDGFERRMGMESGGRGKGLHKKTTRNVELHGDLGRVRCTLCFHDYEARHDWVESFREGESPDCPVCEERCTARVKRSARATPIGSLRPSIVLYDEPHPLGDEIGALHAYDAGRGPDLLLIMGTSLKVSGLKALVKDFAKSAHANKKRGLVVFVNATKPSKEWEGIIDIHVQGQTDMWVDKVEEVWKRVKPADWEIQTTLEMGVVKDVEGVKGVGKGKVTKTKAAAPEAIFVNGMHTPRPSESPSRASSSPSKHDQAQKSAPTCPPTPVSPSKRRGLATPESTSSDSPIKKSRPAAPATGLPPTPGRGNLFASPSPSRSIGRFASNESDWVDADMDIDADADADLVFGSPGKVKPKRQDAKTLSTSIKRPLSRRSNAQASGKGKENMPLEKVTKVPAISLASKSRSKAVTPGSPLKAVVVGKRTLRARTERVSAVMGERRSGINA